MKCWRRLTKKGPKVTDSLTGRKQIYCSLMSSTSTDVSKKKVGLMGLNEWISLKIILNPEARA